MFTTERLRQFIDKGMVIWRTHSPSTFKDFPTLNVELFSIWQNQVMNYLESNLSADNRYIISFKENVKQADRQSVGIAIGLLKAIIEDINLKLLIVDDEAKLSLLNPLSTIFDRFHLIVRQLRNRYNGRATLDVVDEYDVQNLLHSLFILHFDDIRPEEWTPSYAGKSNRMDFLLKDFNTVIEAKKTRVGLTGKEVGSQLIEDIARYQHHQNCDTLLCFVYDPEGFISNPRGLENDLSKETETLIVKVYVRP